MRLYSIHSVNGNIPHQEIKNAINDLYYLCKSTENYIEYSNAQYRKQEDDTKNNTLAIQDGVSNWKWHYYWKNQTKNNQYIKKSDWTYVSGDQIDIVGLENVFVIKPGQAYIVQTDKNTPLIVDIGGGAGSYYTPSSISSSGDNKINLNFKFIEKATDLYGDKQYFVIPGVIGNRYCHKNGDQALNTLNSWKSLEWNNGVPAQLITTKPTSNNSPVAFQNFDPISVEILYDEEEVFIDHTIKTESGAINGQLNHSVLVEIKDISEQEWRNSFENSATKPQARIW